jgi:uncharacterized lipoprotein YmbA
MMKRIGLSFVILCMIAALGACASTPPAKFYTLNPTATPGGASAGFSVSIGPVSVPAVIDRPQMVVRVGPNQVAFDEFNRWASPLKTDIARVVAENLIIKLGTSRVTTFPQSTVDGATYRVTIDVLRFESVPGETATIDALWTIRHTADGRSLAGRSTWKEPVKSSGFDALVAAHSRALDRLSEDIAKALLTW